MQGFPEDHGLALVGRTVEHYRIQSHLGSGGMGHVFRAYDERLNRKVAVKVLRRALTDNETARRRFLREASIAPKVVHPYVATVFDVVEWEGELVLVMEYIEGRPIDVYVRDENSGATEVARLGLEISEALAEIHRHGLVHRDLKPGNVMVTPTGHVKVLDFGLARLAPEARPTEPSSASVDSLTGQSIVGTVLYMSPEQLRREEVDPRSDLFSLGTLLYETITGEHPFRRGTYIDIATAVLQDDPGSGQDQEPGSLSQSGPLRSVVLRLLEKERANRYQSAQEVVTDLRAFLSNQAVPSVMEQEAARRKKRTRQVVYSSLAVAAILALALVTFRVLQMFEPMDARSVVTVLPFSDRAGPAADPVRGEMVASLVAASLSRSGALRSVGHERVMDLLWSQPDESPLEERMAAVRNGVRTRYIVAGTLFHDADSMRAVVDVYGPDETEPVHSFEVGAAGAVGIADRVVSQLLMAPAVAGSRAGKPREIDDPSTGKDEAELLRYRARSAMRQFKFAAAIDLLERSLTLNAGSVLAQTDLADALYRSGFETRAREEAARARRLAEEPGGRAPPEVRWHVIAVEAAIRGDQATRIEARRRLAQAHPDDPRALALLADALFLGGQTDEALSTVDRAMSLDGTAPSLHLIKAQVLLARDRPDDAERELQQADRYYEASGVTPGLAYVALNRGHLRRARGDYEGALASYERSSELYREADLPVQSKIAEAHAGDIHLFSGRLAVAESVYAVSLSEARSAGNSTLYIRSLNALGATLYQHGSLENAETRLRDAIVEARRLENDRLLLEPLVNLSSLCTYVGRIGEAAAHAEEGVAVAIRLGDEDTASIARMILADASYRLGDLARAAEAYRDVIRRQEAPGGDPVGLAWSLAGLSEVLEASGDLGSALVAADRSVALAGEAGQPVLDAYARVQRASVYGAVTRYDAAVADLDAAKVAGAEDPDLADQVTRVRGAVAAQRGESGRALELLREARRGAAESDAPDVEAEALIFASLAAASSGDPAEAVRLARAALDLDRVAAPLRVRARSCLARALAESGRAEEAGREGRLALEEGESLGIRLAAARAAAALVGLPTGAGVADRDAIRNRGREALSRYLGSVPAELVGAVRERADLSELIQTLE